MSNYEVDEKSFDHPRVESNTAATDAMTKALSPYVVATALAPNYNVAKVAASPTLRRAFNVDRQFGAADERDVPSGYAVKLDGTMRIDSRERLEHVFGAWNHALGTSIYPVASLPAGLKGASDDSIEQLNQAARSKMPHLLSPTHRVTLERTTNTFDGDQYAVVVTANDVPATRRMQQYIAGRATSADPLTVETLATSPEYALLHERAQCARDTLAAQYAGALGIALAEPTTTLTSQHYTILPANTLAHGTHRSPVPQQAAREARFFVVYNNASPTHVVKGGVVVSHGIMGGHTVLKSDDNEPWQQPNFLSLMPATSAERHATHTQIDAVHRAQTERSRAAFASRIVWHSDLGDDLQHAAADERFYAMADPYSQKWLARLSPPHAGPLAVRHYSTIAGQLPSVSTLHATPAELGQIARLDETPTNIKVALDNEIVARIAQRWDTDVRPTGYRAHIGEVFANAYDDDEDQGGFRLLSRSSVCLNPAHAHSTDTAQLYADAAQFGLSTADAGGGVGVGSRSYIMLDKALLRLLTKDE